MADRHKKVGRIFSRALENMVTFITYEEPEAVRLKIWAKTETGRIQIATVDKDDGPVIFEWEQADIVGFSIGHVGQAPLVETAKRSPLLI